MRSSTGWKIAPSSLRGTLQVPPSKSHTLRAIFFAALASGTSRIENWLRSPDSLAMIEAVRKIGAVVEVGETLMIQGCNPRVPEDVIDCGNSGIVLRFVGALAGLLPGYTILTGDASIRHSRPVKPLLDGLMQLGAFAVSNSGHAPIIVKGPITGSMASLDGSDSQPVSGLLIAAAFAPHPIEIRVVNPGEKPWIDLTLAWLSKLGIPYEREGYDRYFLSGQATIQGFQTCISGDFSSAAYGIAAALITGSTLTIEHLDLTDSQGDKAVIDLLQKMGAHITMNGTSMTVHPSEITGCTIDVNDFIDALPILAVLGCFARGRTTLVNGAIARNKESDRIRSIVSELKKMGASIEEREDGLVVEQSILQGAKLESHADQRIALSLAVAAMGAKGICAIEGVACADKTYPTFAADFQQIGAELEHHPLRI
jgi:3-phosphoshikimate 1-carboxyvinyltransferase